jgi:hypothetical protein
MPAFDARDLLTGDFLHVIDFDEVNFFIDDRDRE